MAKKSVIQASQRRFLRLASDLMDENTALRNILIAQGIEIPVFDTKNKIVQGLDEAEKRIIELESELITARKNLIQADVLRVNAEKVVRSQASNVELEAKLKKCRRERIAPLDRWENEGGPSG